MELHIGHKCLNNTVVKQPEIYIIVANQFLASNRVTKSHLDNLL